MLSSQDIQQLLPQAYPFVMLDRVIEIEHGKHLIAIKNLTANDWPFSDNQSPVEHFPEPMLIEAAAQAALVLYRVSMEEKPSTGAPRFFLGKVKAEFLRPVHCGDQVTITARATKVIQSGGYSDVDLTVEGEPVASIGFVLGVERNRN